MKYFTEPRWFGIWAIALVFIAYLAMTWIIGFVNIPKLLTAQEVLSNITPYIPQYVLLDFDSNLLITARVLIWFLCWMLMIVGKIAYSCILSSNLINIFFVVAL